MTDELDLFFVRYPERAGFKETGTSKDAADQLEASGRARKLRDLVRGAFELGFVGTADELAFRLNCSVLAIRPRVSELKKQGVIEHAGTRHLNQSGSSAACWRLNHMRRAG